MRFLIAALAVAGIVVSSLALRVHYMDPAAAPPCAVSEHWDCGTVNHSKYSVFPPISMDEKPGMIHIPVALVGIVGYALIAVFALMNQLRVALEFARVGFFCAAFLTYIEAFIIETWCIYCLWSQIIIAAIVLALVGTLLMRRRARRASLRAVLSAEGD